MSKLLFAAVYGAAVTVASAWLVGSPATLCLAPLGSSLTTFIVAVAVNLTPRSGGGGLAAQARA